MSYDLLIVGSGSAGVAAALEAASRGAKAAVIEGGVLGGTCVNVGCVPSKALLRAAEAFHKAGRHPFQGIQTQAERVHLERVIQQKDDLVGSLRQEKYAEVLQAAGVPVIHGQARFLDGETLEVNGQAHKARRYLLATGAVPTLPPIPGLAESQPWTYLEALSPDTHPSTLLVIGGGAIGLEIAQAYARLGTQVTVLEATPYLLPAEDPELSTLLKGYLEAEGLEVHTRVRVQRVERQGEFRVHTDGGTYRAERLLVATGRKARTQGLNLEAAGVELGPRGEIRVDERLRSGNPRIYAAGDAAGLPQFVYVAAQSGRIAARNALGGEEALELQAVPRVTFTDPALATVGLTEEEARQRYGSAIRVSRLPLEQLPKALAQHDPRGMFKLVVDAEGVVLGLSILAPEAGDALQEAVLAVRFGLNYRDLIDTFHPYLTLAEGIRLVAQALDTEVGMLSCCA
ncbi:mercury(II) reductase [Calidithermus roseus]|uniref:Mercuric reductase n=1 Tax=Calidithermus roseus TaxID=1644118 RepID=A0A399EYA7_9DEIN|nr:mercury(II) reductase [Calidithermus roseus]RIH89567.1 Mercuric reductase [Calidithermus roseus]